MQENKNKKRLWSITGIYAAVGLCLIAVAVATWATFSGVSSTIKKAAAVDTSASQWQETSSAVQSAQEAAAIVSSEEAVESASEAPVNTTPTMLTMPVAGEICQPFSGTKPAYSKTLRDWRVHCGTDFTAEANDEVSAVTDGTITAIEATDTQGTVITQSAGNLEIRYCGLSEETLVSVGDTVQSGDTIGTIGTMPIEQAEGSHLHLELLEDGAYQDWASFAGD